LIIDRRLVEEALPSYEIGDELGRGAQAVVFAGRHRRLMRPVAVKVLADLGAAQGGRRGGPRTEAQLAAALNHPHIVQIYEYVEHGGLCLIVMEMLPGGSLAERAASLSLEAACGVGVAAAAALGCAHAHGALHRDMKPTNLLFAEDGSIKVTDFGIAKLLAAASATASGLLGTPLYMAPEQISMGRLGPPTDVYSLGAVLYELLAHRPPFDRELDLATLLHHHVHVDPPPLEDVPPALANVVMKTLAKDGGRRPQSANAFALELARAATATFGPDWLSRCGFPLRLDDDVRDAALTQHITRHIPAPEIPPAHGTVVPASGPPPRPSFPPAGAVTVPPRLPSVPPLPQTGPVHALAGPPPAAGPSPQPSSTGPAPGTSPRPRRHLAVVLTAAALAVLGVASALFLTSRGGGGEAFTTPIALTVSAPDDSVYVGDWAVHRVRKVSPGGKVSAYAGNGQGGSSGDGGPARRATLAAPSGLAVDAAGNVYVADGGNNKVRKISPDGSITTAVGTGAEGASGDGGPATKATLNTGTQFGLALDPSGTLYLTDFSNSKIRRVSKDGTIDTLAGTGTEGFAGDGGPAGGAELNRPIAVAADKNGNVYIADWGNNRVREVTKDGRITTVAGNGDYGFSGDGGPATSAQLYGPVGVAVDGRGNLFIADYGNHRVRKVTPDGRIGTVAGNGLPGFGGDGGPADQARVTSPFGVAVDPAGTLFIADYGNHRIRKVTSDGRISTVAH
jgi:serine/threonine-protein kinase